MCADVRSLFSHCEAKTILTQVSLDLQDHLEPSTSEFSIVLGGEGRLSGYRQGIPVDLCLYSGEQIIWQRAEPSSDIKEGDGIRARITCDGGRWGEQKRFLVAGLPPSLRPVVAIIGAQLCPLVSNDLGQVTGRITLEPTSTGSALSAKLVAREGLKLRAFGASVDLGPVTGAAFDHLGAWLPLQGTEILPVHRFRKAHDVSARDH
jgi:hypothetical protein